MLTSTLSIWLYQFWLFGFTTAKHWGRGPRTWNATNLGFLDWRPPFIDSTTKAPGSPDSGTRGQTSNSPGRHNFESMCEVGPCQFCRWSCHPHYDSPTSSSCENESDTASESESDTEHWPKSWKDPPFEERLKENLESNSFSSVSSSQVPLSVSAIVKAIKSSPNQLLEEAIGFSIMGRNAPLLYDLLQKAMEAEPVSSNFYPFHLAISYLDGSKACCLILKVLFPRAQLRWQLGWGVNNTNDLGHTLLDNLMITILRNHTSVSPGTVDHALRTHHLFPGQEVDICGRWDADSPCYQELLLSGKSTVPSNWKHKFCHTSAQAVYHCIAEMDSNFVDLKAPSGLFLNYCSHCGAKLQLSSLHTLIMTSFYLATAGCRDEDLFGMICCLLSLLVCDINPLKTSKISLPILLVAHTADICSHKDYTPAEFAECLADGILDTWPELTKTGWRILCHILRVAEEIWDGFRYEFDSESESGGGSHGDSEGEREDNSTDPSFLLSCSHHDRYGPMRSSVFGKDKTLGHLWAAAQTELLTYRRQRGKEPWTSQKFDLPGVLKCLEERTVPSIPLVRGAMMKPYCACGFFEGHFSTNAPTRMKACSSYISNMNQYSRETLIDERCIW
jgi:hypothetical protein